MIRPEELRIGNWISNGHTNHAISSSWFCDYLGSLGEHMNTELIPLTEEWLVKFGFETYKFDHKENQYRLKDRLVVVRNESFYDYGSSVKVDYVHQLQNLFFALTGEELTITHNDRTNKE
jgi:hypothetical protein